MSNEREQGRQLGRTQTIIELMDSASGLLSEDGENPEYDRAIVELVADVIGVPHAERALVEQRLREHKRRKVEIITEALAKLEEQRP